MLRSKKSRSVNYEMTGIKDASPFWITAEVFQNKSHATEQRL